MKFLLVFTLLALLASSSSALTLDCPEMQSVVVESARISSAMKRSDGHYHTPWLGLFEKGDLTFSTHVFAMPATKGLEVRIRDGEIGRYQPALEDLLPRAQFGDAPHSSHTFVWIDQSGDVCPPCGRIFNEIEPILEAARCAPDSLIYTLRIDMAN